MKYSWKFGVTNRPSKEKPGVTVVSQDFSISSGDAGDVIPVGVITKARGTAEYVATAVDGADIGTFDTRSKAAHALRKHRVANLTVAEVATEVAADAAAEGEPEIVEPAASETESTEDLGGEAA